ncbi:condensation domain-containing protein [Nonomuraea sp. NPDC049709]|uniref:condensation domain-containing protein n=1 Tax=Nonomuraea sp. NPDC049709 TaxID=3154736 RepID=UPI003427E0AB
MKSASLCWGQRYMWLRVHQLPPEHQHETHVVLRFRVPDGLTTARCRALLTHLTRRHEVLRTTYHLGPEPEQRVDPPRALPVTEVSTERDGTATPADVIDELTRRPFDLAGEWPIRACLITTGGAPKQCVLVLNHLAVDVWTLGEIKRELRTQSAASAARRQVALAPVRHQPSDLARHEASADAAIVAARAMAHWQEEVARLPLDPFAGRRGPAEGPVARHATLISPALLAAGQRIAGRHGVWPSLVHLAAYTAMMALYTGQESVGFLSFVSNRQTHPYPDVMTCMFSPMLVRVDCSGDPGFGELLRRVSESFGRAGEHAYVPYDKVVEMVSREGSARGGEVRLGSEVNFIKQRTKEYGGRRSAFTWNPEPESWAHCGLDTYLRVDQWCDAVSLSLHAMSSVMDAASVERFLRGLEALVLAHDDPAADLRISEAAGQAAFAPPRPAVRSRDAAATGEPPPAAVQALAEAVRDAHGLAHIDPSHSYTLAGGQALRIPQVLADLGRRGWEGLSLQQLAGPAPLAALAGRLAARRRTPSSQIPSNSE